MRFIDYLIENKQLNELKERNPQIEGDGSGLPPESIKEITSLIRKGARDLDEQWKDAVHLTKKAYDVAGFKLPRISEGDAWRQYEHLISVAVRELAKSRGINGEYAKWRFTEPTKHDDTVIPKDKLPLPLGTPVAK